MSGGSVVEVSRLPPLENTNFGVNHFPQPQTIIPQPIFQQYSPCNDIKVPPYTEVRKMFNSLDAFFDSPVL
jgi:hypothetical protein